jgi:hypothetical protein
MTEAAKLRHLHEKCDRRAIFISRQCGQLALRGILKMRHMLKCKAVTQVFHEVVTLN